MNKTPSHTHSHCFWLQRLLHTTPQLPFHSQIALKMVTPFLLEKKGETLNQDGLELVWTQLARFCLFWDQETVKKGKQGVRKKVDVLSPPEKSRHPSSLTSLSKPALTHSCFYFHCPSGYRSTSALQNKSTQAGNTGSLSHRWQEEQNDGRVASNPHIAPYNQGASPGWVHNPPRRGDNFFPLMASSLKRECVHPSCPFSLRIHGPNILWPIAGTGCTGVQAAGAWGAWFSGAFPAYSVLQQALAIVTEFTVPQPIYTTSGSEKVSSKATGRIQCSQWGAFGPN